MKKNKTNNKDIIRIDDNIEIKEEKLKESKVHKKDNKEKSKLNIFFLIICLLITIIYIISLIINYNFNNINIGELINTFYVPIIFIIIIIILFKVNNKKNRFYIILFTIMLILYTTFNLTYSKKDVYVLDFINKDISSVIEWADSNNIQLNTTYEYSDTVLKNHVIMQEYGINTLVKDIDKFTIVVSDGVNYDKEIIVPNMTGLTYDVVMEFIKNNHLNNVSIEFIKSDSQIDTVIEQIGNGTMKRNSQIKFIFSMGNEELSIPVKDLKNLSLFEATSYLKRNNILYEIKYEYNNKIEKDYVISQDIIDEIVQDKLTLVVSLGPEVVVPNLLEMTTEEITKWALSNNIKIKYEEIYNKEIEAGKIIEVSKQSGDKISEDSVITLVISKGSLVMPNVTSLSEFKLWANENNITYEEIYEFSDSIGSGEIIKTSPDVNTKITENDTVVITVSKGKSVTIPSLIGLSKSSIENKCKSLNLSCTFTYGGYTESTKKDISMKQSKAKGSVVAEGTNVLITLSSGIYEKVNVKSFKGMTKSQINSSCNSLGIKCNFKYSSTYSNEAKDTAISQDKTGSVIKGSTVTITLSIGPAKTYTVIIDGSLLSLGNPEQTKKTLKTKLENACPGVNFNFSFKAVNSGIGYLNPDSQVKVGSNTLTQGKTYNVIINSSN